MDNARIICFIVFYIDKFNGLLYFLKYHAGLEGKNELGGHLQGPAAQPGQAREQADPVRRQQDRNALRIRPHGRAGVHGVPEGTFYEALQHP